VYCWMILPSKELHEKRRSRNRRRQEGSRDMNHDVNGPVTGPVTESLKLNPSTRF
jgi:hypothetical protein